MKESSDIDELHAQSIFLRMRGKSTEELIAIWIENNQKIYGEQEFAAVETILRERLEKLPPQRAIYGDPFKTPVKKKNWFDPEPTYTPYSPGPSLRNQIRIAIAVIIFLILSLTCFAWIAMYVDGVMK